MLILDLFEELQGPPEPTLIDALRDFLPLAVKHLKIKKLPKIKLLRDVETEHMPSFGKFSNEDRTIHLGIKNRHPNDILRTLAHEMVHYAQGEHGQLDADSWQTGSPVEDQANAEAGVIMREFNQQFPQYMELKPIVFEEWSKKYKKSINCSNPKGFSQKAHCAGRKKNTNEAEEGCPPATQDISLNLENRQKAINEYGYGPLNPNLPNDEYWAELADKWNTRDIDSVKQNRCGNCGAFDVSKDMQACIAKGIGSEPGSSAMDAVDAGQLGYCKFLKFKCASKRTCDAWIEGGPITEQSEQLEENQEKYIIYLNNKPVSTYPTNREAEYQAKLIAQKFPTMKIDVKKEVCTLSPVQLAENLQSIEENFADGKGPGRAGDSQRHGIPKGATMAELEKAAKASGRKGQLARWQINMRRGKK
jgi:Zn-dependent peptidase ImmA (M78 family)